MTSSTIAELELELSTVRAMSKRDEENLSSSENTLVDKIFLSSSKKRQADLEKHLYHAKSERAHELISLRLIGNQLTGSIRLKSLINIIEPLNSFLEQSAWRFWDRDGKAEKLDKKFSNLLDLRLAGIESGSTELLIIGNTSPDLTGDSALEEGLKNIFGLLGSNNESFENHIHSVGMPACRALSTLLERMEKQNVAAEFGWNGPDKNHVWEGRVQEITRIRALLEDLGEPKIETEKFNGIVQVLSIRNKIEIYRPDNETKIVANYHRSFSSEINELHLGDQREFVVEKTVYPFRVAKTKKDAFTLKSINFIDLSS
ncbi:MAG: hypothetical protein COC20_04760 [Cellvibrionales bacterium]|nr:MAG: hypothetical protein COC20_04760 [Cellvibrionales bacterium]